MRPKAAADLVDALRAVVAARHQKKLEGGNPAQRWTWADRAVTTDTGETVTISGSEPIGAGQLACSCLLSPKCLHVLAVALALPSDAPAAPVPAGPKRPAAAEGLLDAVIAVVPARVQKKLEGGNPSDGWTWTEGTAGWTVATPDGDTVTVGTLGPVGAADLRCTCLLAPKCLHVLAVASAIASGSTAAAAPPEPEPEPAAPPDPPVTLDRGQKAALGQVQRAASAVLLAGATGVGSTAREDLTRAVHGARATGLHRLAKAGSRVLRQVRDLQQARAEFALDDLVDDLAELLLVGRMLGGDQPTASFLGTARKEYEPVGTLRLYGLLTEPVIAATHAGVSTLLCDATGRLWSVSDVRPGDPLRATARYDGSAEVGGLTLSHRALGRSGLFAQNATASDDGRVGTGGGVKAVRSGPSAWSDPGPAKRFATPLATQLDRVFGGREEWLFLRGAVLGAHEDALLLAVDGLSFPVRLVPPSDHPVLRYRDNLRLLSQAPGLPLEAIGRLQSGRRGTVAAYAIGPWAVPEPEERPALVLPEAWTGRCNLGLDLLAAGHVERIARRPTEVAWPEAERPDPLDPVRRRVGRLALGGRGTLPGDARAAVEREIAGLNERMMPHAGRVLAELADAAANARTEGGDRLPLRWLAAAHYLRVAGRSLQRAGWR